jgi:hypothetical protein
VEVLRELSISMGVVTNRAFGEIAQPEIFLHALGVSCYTIAPAVADWAVDTMRLMVPMRALSEPIPIDIWLATPAVYIVCRDHHTILPEWSRRKARDLFGIEAVELPGGHCPHFSRPADPAELLNAIV